MVLNRISSVLIELDGSLECHARAVTSFRVRSKSAVTEIESGAIVGGDNDRDGEFDRSQ